MVIEYLKVSQFVEAVTRFREKSRELANQQVGDVERVRAQVDNARDVLTHARAVVHFFLASTLSFFAQVDALEACAMAAERDDDLQLAADIRDSCDRMSVHAATRVVEALTGEARTMERVLSASVKKVAKAKEEPKSSETSNVVALAREGL